MATLRTYRCKSCGYEVQAEPEGHFALMSGEYYMFSCKDCKEIVEISAHSLSQMNYAVHCPECHGENLSTWNPIEGHCPKCGGPLEEDPDEIIMAD